MTPFEVLEATAKEAGVQALFDKLEEILQGEKRYAQLFDALLMKKRFAIGLPIEGSDAFRDLPEETQIEVEGYYIQLCRRVGGLFLESGDIPTAWQYFRTIDEPAKVAEAIERWEASGAEGQPPQGLESILDISIQQGVHPRRGFELVLRHHGIARAVALHERPFAASRTVKAECARLLVDHLTRELEGILRRELSLPDEALRGLIEKAAPLVAEKGSVVEVSHLRAVIRAAAIAQDRESLERAVLLTEYGAMLPRRLQGSERPPFEDFFPDQRIFLRALLGTGVDGALRYFRRKADAASLDADGRHLPGETVVALLHRLGRPADAVEAHWKYLKSCREVSPSVPGLLELCGMAGNYARVLEHAREKDDLLQFAVALLKSAGTP